MLGELTLYAIDEFWRRARNQVGAVDAERALLAVIAKPHEVASKLWAALLLHAAKRDTALLPDLLACLSSWDLCSPPPAEFLSCIGFRLYGEQTIAPSENVDLPVIEPRELLNALRSIDLLNQQTVAEIFLALVGNKFSRVTGHSSVISQVAHTLRIPFFVSSQSIKPINDFLLRDFSNRSIPGEYIRDIDKSCDVYSYFGGDVGDQVMLSVLDQLNMAGAYLGIPSCCRAFFFNSWDAACRDHDGDLAFLLFSSQPNWSNSGAISVAWQCNPYGMYAGGGLTWHFPCSITCAETIRIVNERFDIISKIDAKFARECRSFQKQKFTIMPNRVVKFENGDLSGKLILSI
jgi:hypothetical protein